MRGLTKCLKALANERRLRIVYELSRREPLTINSLAKRIGLSIKSTSKHIQKLVDCELLEKRQHSLFMWCHLNRKHSVLKINTKPSKVVEITATRCILLFARIGE